MEVIKNFGLDPLLLSAQIINFLIILFILKKFAFRPILEILKKREKIIKEGLADADEGRKILEDAKEKEKGILKSANINAEKITSNAKLEALEIAKEIQEKSKKESENILKTAREQIELDYKDAEKKLALKTSRTAVEFLENSLKNLFGNEKQKELMQIAIKKIGKTN